MKGVICFILGLVAGVSISWIGYRYSLKRYVTTPIYSDIATYTATLTLARDGKYDRLIDEREFDLTTSLGVLAQVETPDSLSDKEAKIVLAAENYFRKYPLTVEDAELSQTITNFLDKVRSAYSNLQVNRTRQP